MKPSSRRIAPTFSLAVSPAREPSSLIHEANASATVFSVLTGGDTQAQRARPCGRVRRRWRRRSRLSPLAAGIGTPASAGSGGGSRRR